MSRLVEVAVPLPLQDAYTYELPEGLAEIAKPGARVEVPFGRRNLVGYVVGFPAATTVPRIRPVERVLDDPPLLTPQLVDLARWIASYYACSVGEALRAVLPGGVDRKRGARRGRDAERGAGGLLESTPPAHLNGWQQSAFDRIVSRIDAGGFEAFLLHGVTGSGKTEVYLHAIRHALQRGRAAILLIPEIALTPQAADRFRARLGAEIGILHSGMTNAERHDVLVAAARGEIQVVLGARSAVFAPFRNLGLVVVDEEQEASYKQGEKPRYHARAVALMRGRLEGAAVLLGSATPSLESYHNAVKGKHVLLQIPSRVDARPLPRVHLVDMRDPEERSNVLSRPLLDALAGRVERSEQSILLLNRRGHSNYVQCFGCGSIVQCPYCDISLTYHATDRRLRCHYCNHVRPVPEECPGCGNPVQVFKGVGTQQLEQALHGLLPRARVVRMDLDTTSRRGAHRKILEDFGRGDIDVLLGTQMVAKGHDFPGVTLVGVVNADAGLSLPDFRAAERTFQLLAQVAGRAGRGEQPGDVYFQTLCPEHDAIRLAAAQDMGAFYAHESRLRQDLGYPPFARLTEITGLGPDRAELRQAMERVEVYLRGMTAGLGSRKATRAGSDRSLRSPDGEARPERSQAASRPEPAAAKGVLPAEAAASPPHRPAGASLLQVLGPAPSPIPRLRGRYRDQLLLKGTLLEARKRDVQRLLADISRTTPGVEFQVDVDPVNML
jgi:primosomal protein N'